MSFNTREAAERLLELADKIEKAAAESTIFRCSDCGNEFTLAAINSTRARYASEYGLELNNIVTIGDTVECNSCGGDLKYASTPDSDRFYIEASDSDTEDEDSNTEDEDTDEEVAEDSEKDTKEEDNTEAKQEKDTEDSVDKTELEDGVEMRSAPEEQFGEGDKKKRNSRTAAFLAAVDRYSV